MKYVWGSMNFKLYIYFYLGICKHLGSLRGSTGLLDRFAVCQRGKSLSCFAAFHWGIVVSISSVHAPTFRQRESSSYISCFINPDVTLSFAECFKLFVICCCSLSDTWWLPFSQNSTVVLLSNARKHNAGLNVQTVQTTELAAGLSDTIGPVSK